MTTLIEQKSEKDIKQKRNNHTDEEIEIDLMGVLRRIMGIRTDNWRYYSNQYS